MTLKSDAKFQEKPKLLFQKLQEFDEFWSEHSEISKICNFIGPFCAKHITFDLKKYRGIIFHGTIDLKKDWCVVWKMAWGIWQFFKRTLESVQIGTFIGSFYPKLKMNEIKNYKGVMCYDKNKWRNIWKGIDLSVQNWHEEFNNFDRSTGKSLKKCTLMGCF